MSDVSVIGLGAMGAALARTLLDTYEVTVWNRTAAKAESLVDAGAVLADTPEAAIAASPVTVICVGNYDDTRGVLGRDPTALSGRTVIQLTTATGGDAQSLADWSAAQGADYLDGEILAYPSEIGDAATMLLLAGDNALWQTCESILRTLGGATRHVGEDVRLPAMLNLALMSPMMGMIAGVIHGALECEKSNFSVADYTEMLTEMFPVAQHQIQHLATTIAQNNFGNTEAALKTYAAPMSLWVGQCEERGVNTEFPAFIDGWLQRGMAAGYGDEEISALIKLLR
jgi:3-hydroxyisobutyrate dehydrogenase-like beta-hydroxyacid dehydrogenase